MKKLLVLFFLSAIIVTSVHAVDIEVKGNGANSDNSVTIDTSSQTTANQGSKATVVNNINAQASTGNNTVSGNTNGSAVIDTGDSSIQINVNNNLNNNSATVPCSTNCPKPTIRPTQAPAAPTSIPGSNGGNGGGSNGGNNNGGNSGSNSNNNSGNFGSSNGATGGAGTESPSVLGLSATDSEQTNEVIAVLGAICATIGSSLLFQRKNRV